jgi:drug/metabolite transporter (DMT)-like permease
LSLIHLAQLVSLAALWGSSFLFMRSAVPEFGPVALIGVRVGLAAIILFSLVVVGKKLTQLRDEWKKLLLLGFINSCVPFLLFAWAALSLPAGISSILNATAPIFAAILGWLWLGDVLERSRWAGIFIAFLGVIVLVWAQGKMGTPSSVLAILGCLLAGFCYGIGSNFTKRYMQGTDPLVNAAGSQISATVCLLPFLWAFWPATNPSVGSWAAASVLAVFCTALAYLLFFRLIASIGPSKTITVTFLIPVFGCLFGALFLNESITLGMIMGGVVVLAGTSLAVGLLKLPSVRARTPR